MILVLFLVGFVFRIWFTGLVPQPFVYDQNQYYGFALGIIQHGLHADIYRLYGYPLIITPLIFFFGVKSALGWTVFHAFLDCITALLVFWIARKLFRKETPAWIAYVGYLLNPFSAGYVGVLLSEIVTTFLMTAIFALILKYLKEKSYGILFLLSLLVGFLPHVRPAFVYWSMVLAGWLILVEQSRIKRIVHKLTVAMLVGVIFVLPFSYTIVGNYVYYHEFAPLSVDRVFARELYASLFISRGLAFTDTRFGVWPREALEVWGELARPKNRLERDTVAKKYIGRAIEKIKSAPLWFIRSRITKMGYVWEKHFVFPYAQGRPTDGVKRLTYWGNMAILAFGIFGIIQSMKDIKKIADIREKKMKQWFTVLSIFLFVYISVIHTISTSEERFSLPAYPIVFLYVGYAIASVRIFISGHRGRKRSTTD